LFRVSELFDSVKDPHETINLAENEGLQEERKILSVQLAGGWKEAVLSVN